MYYGIDVSVHNGTVDFSKVKAAGNSFVIIREGYGDVLSYPSQKDSRFETNYANAKAVGLNIGVYHYLYATTVAGAKREAQGLIANIKGKTPLSMPVALDIEEKCQYDLSQSTVEAIVEAFMDVVEAAGYYCVLYSYESFLTAKMSAAFRGKYDIWCANITRTPAIKYGIHQYSFTGSISGISGSVDLDRTTTNYPSLISSAGLNGYPKSTATPPATVKMQSTYTSTPTAIRINWGKVSGATGYRVYRYNATTKKWVSLGTIKDGTTTTYRDSKSLVPGTQYQYKVKAYVKVGGVNYWGTASSAFTASTKSVPTVKLKSSYTATSSAIRINWNAVSGADGYRIYRYNASTKKWDTLKTVSSKVTTYRDSGLAVGTAYKYKVKAYIRVGGAPYWGSASETFKAVTK